MKYIKLLAVAFGALVMSACSDSKDYNTAADVTVEMDKSEITIKEHVGRFTVPVKINGNPNGDVRVKVKVEPSGNNPAKPYEESNGSWSGNYIVTADEINISADEKIGYIEIFTVDDKVENDDRSFIVTIESAQGASVGISKTTLVIMADNDKFPYEKIQGSWQMSYKNYDNAEESMTVTLTGYDESSKKYGVELMLDGMMSQYSTDASAQVYFFDDESIDMRYVEIVLPQDIGTYAGDPTYHMWLIPLQRDMAGQLTPMNSSVLTGFISDDYQTIEFDENLGFGWYIADAMLDAYLGWADFATDIVMTRL